MFALCRAVNDVTKRGVERSHYEQINDEIATSNKGTHASQIGFLRIATHNYHDLELFSFFFSQTWFGHRKCTKLFCLSQ